MGGNMSFHTGIDNNNNNNNNTNLSSPSSAPGSSSTYQNTSSYQQSRQQPLQQQHTSNSSGDDSEEVMISHVFKKTPHHHQQQQSMQQASSPFSKSNVKLHNSNSLMQQINPDHHQYMQSSRANSYNSYHHLNPTNKYHHHQHPQMLNSNDNFYHQNNSYPKEANLNRTTAGATSSSSTNIYNQVYPTNQFDSNQYCLYNQQQQHHNSQNYRRFNGVNAYLNSLPLGERTTDAESGDVEMHHKNNNNAEKNSQNNIRNSYEPYEQHTKRKLFSEVSHSATSAQQQPSGEHSSEINSSLSSMSSNNNNNNNNSSSSNYNLENRVLESYLNTIKKVGETVNGGGTTVLYKNYSHSDECNQSDFGERYSDTGSTFNKSV